LWIVRRIATRNLPRLPVPRTSRLKLNKSRLHAGFFVLAYTAERYPLEIQVFTGIVQDLALVQAVSHQADITRLTLDIGELSGGLTLGASVAVNGTCLTVTRVDQGNVHFDVIVETLRNTNLGTLEEGDYVNVERSFTVGDEVGGHIVSGHVTGTAALLERRVEGHNHVIRLGLDPNLGKFIFHKGFVALDGASLTVSMVNREQNFFEISLIPETLARTTLGSATLNTPINVEVDAQTVTTVETVERLFADPEWRADLVNRAQGESQA